MDKLKMHSPNITQDNIARIRDLFPGCVTEARGEDGNVELAVDFDQLRQELSSSVVEGPQERYHLNWPGKREALLAASAPIAKTLRPCREQSVNFDITKNLFIEGDNLDVLKLLQESYLGKVDLIYIDPPYNTGNDFIYEDDYSEGVEDFLIKSSQKSDKGHRLVANTDSNGRFHSDWLSMIYPRLKLAKNLLSNIGLIFISIDTNEEANLTNVADEIFGRDNRLASIVWEKRFTRSNNAKTFATLTERVLCYRKSNALDEIKEPRNDKADSTYTNPDNDSRGVWTSVSYVNPATKEQRPNLCYPIKNPATGKDVVHPTNAWKYERSVHESHIRENRLYWGVNGDNTYPRLKKFLTEMDGGMVPVDFWDRKSVGTTDEASKYLASLLGAKVFDFPKPYTLIKRALQLCERKNAIVMDFFSGTAPTGEAVIRLNSEDGGNRKFILVQLPEECEVKSDAYKAGYKTIAEIGKDRIRHAGEKIKTDGLLDSSNLDVGFRVLKIDTSNMTDVYYTPDSASQDLLGIQVNNVKADRTPEDLLFQVMLDWGVDLSLPIAKQYIQGKLVFFVDGNALAACFDVDGGIDEDFVKELAKLQPLRVVFRDAGFKDSSVKINVEQIFKLLSPSTEVKCI